MLKIEEVKIGIIGLGYVGLPLAVEFGKLISTVGFDINENRITELISGKDSTLEVDANELSESLHLSYSSHIDDLKACNVYIVTVPGSHCREELLSRRFLDILVDTAILRIWGGVIMRKVQIKMVRIPK